ncbi:hypothetical protein PV325_007127 [Microctonus aethiopoides]|nr:hypothetical protein PV325_007127 [Microctonus aethiopoides]KAK0079484.1 hypothetical protein PV326_008706 [Microctonus aethiopoides]
MTSLQQGFQRLSTNCLETFDQQMIEFIRRREGLSIYSSNCQSLRAHATDVEFHQKKLEYGAEGIAIYHNKNNTVNVLTSHVRLIDVQSTSSATVTEDVSDICISVCTRDSGKLLPQRDDLKPLTLTGDFNVNFALDTSMKLIDLLQQQLNLQMIDEQNISILT